jgi:hypothetical protein
MGFRSGESRMIMAYVLVAVVVVWRIALLHLNHPPFHFTPELAALLFLGYRAPRKLLWLPALAALAGADVYLNSRYGYKITGDLYFVLGWAWYAAMIWLGSALKSKHDVLRIAGAAVGGSISFFLVSNFSVWLVWHMYPMTFAGLLQCYAAGVPFYRGQFVGDLIFTAIAFSLPLVAGSLSGAAEPGRHAH